MNLVYLTHTRAFGVGSSEIQIKVLSWINIFFIMIYNFTNWWISMRPQLIIVLKDVTSVQGFIFLKPFYFILF